METRLHQAPPHSWRANRRGRSHQRSALVDGLEGRKSLELISALYESIETGQEVALHFSPRSAEAYAGAGFQVAMISATGRFLMGFEPRRQRIAV